MSLRWEQYQSLTATREFLLDLLRKSMPRSEMKKKILSCLRHYPPLMKSGKPMFSKDDLTKD